MEEVWRVGRWKRGWDAGWPQMVKGWEAQEPGRGPESTREPAVVGDEG